MFGCYEILLSSAIRRESKRQSAENRRIRRGLGTIPVIFGAVLHNASTILVVGNSLRILFYDMDKPLKIK